MYRPLKCNDLNRDVIQTCIDFENGKLISPELKQFIKGELDDDVDQFKDMYDITREVYRELFLRKFEDILDK